MLSDESEKKTLLRHSGYDGEHSRHVYWTADVPHDTGWYEAKNEWKQLFAMIRVTRNWKQSGITSIEHAYYISSAPYDAKRLSELIRRHRGIENYIHWQLDALFSEDDIQTHKDRSPENLSVLRKIAKIMLQAYTSFPASIRR